MPGDGSINIPPTLDVVQVGAAVGVQKELSGSIRWFVLEQTEHPDANLEELPVASPLAAELLGKRVGDTVVIAKGQIHDRVATVRQISMRPEVGRPRESRKPRFQRVPASAMCRYL
jgi:transcription elongation GreA/GreB family factor